MDKEKRTSSYDPGERIKEILELDGSRLNSRRKFFVFTLIGFALVGTVFYFLMGHKSNNHIQYKTAPVKKGNLVVEVTATGTLLPVGQVEVGVEISGTIDTVMVDCNDKVTKGQILAKLDTSEIEAKVLQAQANFQLALAKLRTAKAELKLAKVKLEQYIRARKLTDGKLPSEIEMEKARTNLEKAVANKLIAEAEVERAKAELDFRKTNLSKAIIRSPIDGIVLARNIEPGQTVAASLKTPVLFVIARDLLQMELHVDIDEADIGKVKKGQRAIFTVDAYPNREFKAQVKDILLSPKTTEGVVTYETILTVKNSDRLLLPGMTATTNIVVKELKNVLLVPNAALRFDPRIVKEHVSGRKRGGLLGFMFPRFSRTTSSTNSTVNMKLHKKKCVWVLEKGSLVKVPVVIGDTNGIVTHIVEGNLSENQKVVTGLLKARTS